MSPKYLGIIIGNLFILTFSLNRLTTVIDDNDPKNS
jgi:hypothetical protein